MSNDPQRYHRHRFPPEIISHAVWLYHRFCLSFRDVEDLLAERGVIVSYETIRSWCAKFGPEYARKARQWRGQLGDTWRPTSTKGVRGKALLPQAAERAGERTSMVDHRQAQKLRGRAPECDALGGACHRALREQPSRGLASADATRERGRCASSSPRLKRSGSCPYTVSSGISSA